MNLPELQNDEALRQREFPVCADKVYLAHAGVSPVPACVTRAVQETAAAAALDDQEGGLGDLLRSTRSRAAACGSIKGANYVFTPGMLVHTTLAREQPSFSR